MPPVILLPTDELLVSQLLAVHVCVCKNKHTNEYVTLFNFRNHVKTRRNMHSMQTYTISECQQTVYMLQGKNRAND